MIMHAALSSVNFGLNSKPREEKNSIDFFRSRTARLTKMLRVMVPPKSVIQQRRRQSHVGHHTYRGPALMASQSSTGMTTTVKGVPASSVTIGSGLPNSLSPSIEFL